MKDYSNKYKYRCFTNGKGQRVVIAMSTYEGKVVRGIAKCNDDIDTFDLEYGKRLAQARCDKAIAEKRVNRATERVEEAKVALEKATEEMVRMLSYLNDSNKELAEAEETLEKILDERK